MSVLAMTVIRIEKHRNADTLRIYELQAPGEPSLVVVANLERVYELGDVVAVARVGATLNDGTQIRKNRLRGVDSFGLTLGLVEVPAGTDLTPEYCPKVESTAPTASDEVAFVKWASIEQLHAVRFALQARHDDTSEPWPRVTYRAKVKVDGTNAAIHALPSGFVAQSRTRLLSLADDNYGFAAWAHTHHAWSCELGARLGRAVVFGEWCGRGIQKRSAISRIDRAIFAVFAIQLGDPTRDTARLVVEPERLAAMLPDHPDVFVLPWYGEAIELDFSDPEHLREQAKLVDAMVAKVEALDPWVAEILGVEGIGEGVVLYPVDGVPSEEGSFDRDRYVSLMFKAKGEEHRVNRQSRAAQIEPEVARSVAEFVALMVTPARLEQGLEQVAAGGADLERMGEFLQWVGQDVQKESVAELAAAGLTWKQVASAIGKTARQWLIAKAATL